VVIRRGEVWWADLPDATAAGPGYRRPVLVVQSDAFNASKIDTVLVAVLTSNLDRARSPGNVLIASRQSGLPRDSVVNVSQMLTIDRSALVQRVGKLSGGLMTIVDAGLKLVLELD
jgi:mRNA interferase MazF